MSDSLLSVEAALAHLLAGARPLEGRETLPADAALGRVLAEPMVSDVTVPPLDNSAMDGYAVQLADCDTERWLPVSQRIPAGSVGQPLAAGTAARIFTGAPLPAGADTVVMQEDCEAAAGQVRVTRAPKPGANIRRAGEDIATGQTVLVPGTRLGAAQLGVAASVGATTLTVYPRVKVAAFFTGDEIVLPGTSLKPGQIYNSNRAALLGLLHGLGCEVIDLGQIADSLEATVAALQKAAAQADVIITSGGVSVGEEDHVKSAVQQLGSIDMWKVAMKPGKPLVHGRIGNTDFVGLPGNPVSSYVTFLLAVAPVLRVMQGMPGGLPRAVPARADFDWSRPDRRREFLRAKFNDAGGLDLFPNQSSGVLTSLAWADGLVDVDAGVTLHAGDPVRFMPLSELLS